MGVIGTITPVSHAYAHGTIGRFEDGIITFFKVNPAKTKDGHTVSEVTISLDNIQKAADVIGELSNHLGDLASRVVDHMEALGRT